jgi:hypothetical protein
LRGANFVRCLPDKIEIRIQIFVGSCGIAQAVCPFCCKKFVATGDGEVALAHGLVFQNHLVTHLQFRPQHFYCRKTRGRDWFLDDLGYSFNPDYSNPMDLGTVGDVARSRFSYSSSQINLPFLKLWTPLGGSEEAYPQPGALVFPPHILACPFCFLQLGGDPDIAKHHLAQEHIELAVFHCLNIRHAIFSM